jgi:hypothetical protein
MRAGWIGLAVVLAVAGIATLFAQTMAQLSGLRTASVPSPSPARAAKGLVAPTPSPVRAAGAGSADPMPGAAASALLSPAATTAVPAEAPDTASAAPVVQPERPTASVRVTAPAPTTRPADTPARSVAEVRAARCRSLVQYLAEIDQLALAGPEPGRLAWVDQQRRITVARQREIGC